MSKTPAKLPRNADLGLPPPRPDQAFMTVSALEAGNMVVPLDYILAGRGPEEQLACPSLAFFLLHSRTGKRVLFDLGLPRDFSSYPFAVQSIVTILEEGESAVGRKGCFVRVTQTAAESLSKGGLNPEAIDFVVLSHLHFDHTGDHRPFTKATFVLGGESKSLLDTGYPKDPTSQISGDSLPIERTHFLYSDDFTTSIGPFPNALDFFGDGSLYIVDMPGHLPGNINILARTSTSGSWILLGGDTAHHVHLLTGEAKMAYNVDAFGVVRCAHMNKEAAEKSIERVTELLEMGMGKVQVLIAHDVEWYEANRGGIAFFPGAIQPLT